MFRVSTLIHHAKETHYLTLKRKYLPPREHVFSFKVYVFTSMVLFFLLPFLRGEQLCVFLFGSLDNSLPKKGSTPEGKNLFLKQILSFKS